MGNVRKNILHSPDLQMHFVVLLWGFTAILGKLISLSGPVLVWHRLWMTVLTLMFLPGMLKTMRGFTRGEWVKLSIVGILTALHWVAFYGSIKMGDSASLALSTLATSSFFAALLEPVLTKTRFDYINLFLGALVFLGVRIIYADQGVHAGAFFVGLFAGFLAALFSTLNKKWVTHLDAGAVTLGELSIGFLFLTLILPLFLDFNYPLSQLIPRAEDWIYLIILSVLCTAFTFVVALKCLKYISAFKSNLYVNLEPVYGIILAALFLKEYKSLSTNFFLGASIIILAVFIKPIVKWVVKPSKYI